MEKTYAEQLYKKKGKIESILADKIESRNWFARKVGTQLICGFDAFKSNMEDCDLEIEALQGLIDSIDSELRKEAVVFEPMSPKDLIID